MTVLATCGWTDSWTTPFTLVNALGTMRPATQYTALLDDHVTAVSVQAGTASAAASISVALYDITLNRPFNLLAGPFVVPVPIGGIATHAVAVTPVPLAAGTTYLCCLGDPIGTIDVGFRNGLGNETSANISTDLLPIWVHIGYTLARFGFFATITNIPPSIKIFYPCCAQLIP